MTQLAALIVAAGLVSCAGCALGESFVIELPWANGVLHPRYFAVDADSRVDALLILTSRGRFNTRGVTVFTKAEWLDGCPNQCKEYKVERLPVWNSPMPKAGAK